ncbi:hypothetical protein Acr_20g0011510 [Actinidia rufa]|uniref:Uncharacterized protein n=1 Tax=Actinidia rufa TaxID=165716 RepID=A0A7J0GEV9_9ERIC|nr:hypothetical protein Acr_20g0011510 [Actinidia rufa]
MASSNRGRGFQRGRGRGGKLYSPDSGKFIDAEGFTMVKSKRGGSIGTSSSHSVNQSKATMADIVARDEMTDYIPKELSPHICYIEQEDYNLLEDPLMIRKEYFSPFQAPTLYGSNKEDTEECILAGESQDPEDDLDENIDDQEYHELASFWHSLKEDKRIRPKSKP